MAPELKFVPDRGDGGREPNEEALKDHVYLAVRVEYNEDDYDSFHGWVRPQAAALVKAAPALLKALTDLVKLNQASLDDSDSTWLDEARAAISKATS